MEEEKQVNTENLDEPVDTQHEAHPHAHKRILIGFGAIVILAVVAFIIWPKWGGVIKEKCFGDGEVCQVPLPQ